MIDVSSLSWSLALTEPGTFATSSATGRLRDHIPAKVPGTVAGALAAAGRYDPDNPVPLHGKDVWYETRFEAEPGACRLCFDGLATIAEVYLNDECVLASGNMFRSYQVPVALKDRNVLKICFRALEPELHAKGPRARWKPQLATNQGLRLIRTTLLGHMPGWCPEIHAVGPYRPVRIVRDDAPRIVQKHMLADLTPDGSASLTVWLRLENTEAVPVVICAGSSAAMNRQEDGSFAATLRPRNVTPWMPHTHGEPALYEVSVRAGDEAFSLGRTGFRRIEPDHGADGKGFGLTVNGVPVFCRGAVLTNADLLNLGSDRDTYRPLLQAARDAGMNMLRIGGTMLYEGRAFFELCDELGLLVWQDFQFANYDYPVKDEAFVAEVSAEIRDQLDVSMGCPSLAVLCGGSEIYQQGAMMGLPEDRWKGPLCEEILPGLTAEIRADVPYAANSPCGGALPFLPNEGIAHYYGVGAYMRPLEDARRANVRFAAECLAFSNIPDQQSLDEGLAAKPGHDPRWKARVPRDRGAGWDFEDVRDHYLKTLYGVDPAALRYGDPDRYLDLGRAVTGEVMEASFAEWRRKGSSCRGALVWTLQDLALGAGWGLIDALGRPKPAWYALKRAFRPLQVCLTDEGTNGLAIHVINERPVSRRVTLGLKCLREGKIAVVSGERDLELPARSTQTFNAVDLIGTFFDVTYAYRFGPPSHDITVVELRDGQTGEVQADAFHFPLGRTTVRTPASVSADLVEIDDRWWLELETDRMLSTLTIRSEGFRPAENGFHLAPAVKRRVELQPEGTAEAGLRPSGSVTALTFAGTCSFR